MGRRNPAVNLRVTERELAVLMSKVGYASQYTTLRDKLVAASADMREAKRLKNREAKMARFRKSREAIPSEPDSYPPDPYWGKDGRGRFIYTDYDGEQLTLRFEEGDLWADKLGEGPVYIRKQDIPVIIAALNEQP